jgi:hypothetical protein
MNRRNLLKAGAAVLLAPIAAVLPKGKPKIEAEELTELAVRRRFGSTVAACRDRRSTNVFRSRQASIRTPAPALPWGENQAARNHLYLCSGGAHPST